MTISINSETAPEDLDGYSARLPEHGDLRQVKTKFQPWHHPRKQYVRIHQWCDAVQKLVKELSLGPGDPFRYLTLPGDELLDVRALHGVCEQANVKLRYLGFNNVKAGSSEQTELSISRSEVRSLAAIDEFSSVVEDRLEAITNTKTTAHERAQGSGPFHAINIDLCDSITFRDVGHPRGSYLGVLEKLLELQLQMTKPWLLFVTTKAEPSLLSDRSKEGFSSAIASNTAVSSEFKAELAKLLSVAAEDLEARLDTAWQKQDAEFLRLYSAGLGKWLLRLLSVAQPPREMVLLSSCYYQVGPNGPDMLSLAFRCSTAPQRIYDRDGVLLAAKEEHEFSEERIAVSMAKRIGECFDLDSKLSTDGKLAEKLVGQAGRLLATARYSEIVYSAWALDALNSRKSR